MIAVKFILYAPRQKEKVVERKLSVVPRVGETVHLPEPDDYAWHVYHVSYDLNDEVPHAEVALRRI